MISVVTVSMPWVIIEFGCGKNNQSHSFAQTIVLNFILVDWFNSISFSVSQEPNQNYQKLFAFEMTERKSKENIQNLYHFRFLVKTLIQFTTLIDWVFMNRFYFICVNLLCDEFVELGFGFCCWYSRSETTAILIKCFYLFI